jgi:IrrE N-terminal-like domain
VSVMAEPPDIEALAKKHLIALDMWRLPVNPLAIAREEGIELAPGRYGEKFDARIKFVRSAKTFILFYKEAAYGRTEGRVRFSIGHELGHYYLPHHRQYLLSGLSHNSVTDFRSRDPREMEADEFASALLMPNELFAAALKSRRMTICTLADLSRLAENAFQTSLTSTVRRYVGLDWEACSMVVSQAGVVKWAMHSESMRALGMSWIDSGIPVPSTTPTAKLWDCLGKQATLEPMEGGVGADLWFERPYRRRLWEETMPLGYTGQVLTFLVSEDDD